MSEQLYLKNYPVQHLSYKMRTLEANIRGSPPEYTLGKGVLEICSKFTGERPC